jgi:Ala-tRNA(Pro) deacylase
VGVHDDRVDAVGRHHPGDRPQWSLGRAGDHSRVHRVDDPEVPERLADRAHVRTSSVEESFSIVIAEQVKRVLEDAGVEFESLVHERTDTASAEAKSLGIAPGVVAKTLLLATPEGRMRVVIPASERLDLHKVCAFLQLPRKDVDLLSEEELARDYPEFELGAVPPFGGRADRVLVDSRLAGQERVVLEAGSHDTSLRLRTNDLTRLTGAVVLDLCRD